ncbi:MAG: hypothetical protein QG640_22, partial [Patescibacteria group bacterium]|nr:hypothetical protein [Patescibacteria group bacterium]
MSIFSPKNEHFGALSSQTAVEFFRSLIFSEARRLGIGLNNVHISTKINVHDGGVDASVNGVASKLQEEGSGLIKEGLVSYQIKTGRFEVQQESKIKEELFGRGKEPTKENLGSSIRKCLESDGTYVLVLFGEELSEEQFNNGLAIVTKLLQGCGYENPKLDIWCQSHLVGFTGIFPTLSLELAGFSNSQFQTHSSWAREHAMTLPLVLGEEQTTFIKNLQLELRKDDQANQVHICGEAGIGKTRLVLEATRTEDLAPLVAYYESPADFKESALLIEVLKEDNHFPVIIVIDECDPSTRVRVWNKLKNLGARIKLVTIWNEHDSRAGEPGYFTAPLLGDDEIKEIISQYGILDDTHRWVEFCGGSPRVAHVLGWNLKNNPDDILKPQDHVNIWDRYIIGADDANDTGTKQRQLVLKYLALFKKFGFGEPVSGEATEIASLIERADPQITLQRFHQIIKELKSRKILQGETTLYISPKALHVYLWKEWWDTYGGTVNFQDFYQELPETLKEWFSKMFKYASESESAARIVVELLGEAGIFTDYKKFETPQMARFFRVLTEANPVVALECLKKTIAPLDRATLYGMRESRREMVWALERIAIWKELFCDSARILLKLAEAENEFFSNNASGVFPDLFSPGAGSVAPTEASLEDRFPVLEEAIESTSIEVRLLAIDAVDKALEVHHFSRSLGAEYQGLRQAKLWTPQNQEEIINWYRGVWKLCVKKLPDLTSREQAKGIEVLLRHAGSLTLVLPIEVAVEIISDLPRFLDYPTLSESNLIEIVERVVHYQSKSMRPEVAAAWEKLRSDLLKQDFSSLMRRYVGMDLIEDKFDQNGNRVDILGPKIVSLVDHSIIKPEDLQAELPWLVTNAAVNARQFGYQLGKKDEKQNYLSLIIAAQEIASENRSRSSHGMSSQLLGGYITAISERSTEESEAILISLSENEKLMDQVPFLIWSSGLSESMSLLILKMAEEGKINPEHFDIFKYGSILGSLSKEIFTRWIKFLINSGTENAELVALSLSHAYYLGKDKNSFSEELVMKVLTHPILFDENNRDKIDSMYGYYWAELAKAALAQFPEANMTLAQIIVENLGNKGSLYEGYDSHAEDVLNHITKTYPNETWELVKKYLGPPIDDKAYIIKRWLRGGTLLGDKEGLLTSFDERHVWAWVDEDIERRAWYLASFVPKKLFRKDGEICWVRELLVRYGDRADVRRNLNANFYSEGWTGSASSHHEKVRENLLDFRREET